MHDYFRVCGMYRVPGTGWVFFYTNHAREHPKNNVAFVTLRRSSSMRRLLSYRSSAIHDALTVHASSVVALKKHNKKESTTRFMPPPPTTVS